MTSFCLLWLQEMGKNVASVTEVQVPVHPLLKLIEIQKAVWNLVLVYMYSVHLQAIDVIRLPEAHT